MYFIIMQHIKLILKTPEIIQVTVNKIEVLPYFRLISGDFRLNVPNIVEKGTLVSC